MTTKNWKVFSNYFFWNIFRVFTSMRKCYTAQYIIVSSTLRKKCPYSECFWSVFSRIRSGLGPKKLGIRTLFKPCNISTALKAELQTSKLEKRKISLKQKVQTQKLALNISCYSCNRKKCLCLIEKFKLMPQIIRK